jgi:Na+-driven multidrug efflux pump
MQHFDKELVSGSILRSVWKLSWPVTLLNLVNGTHGFVDHILVGRFVESANNEANAAIGVAWQVFLVVVVFIASLFHGMNVLIARYAGMQDRENMGKVFYQALLMSVFLLVGVVAPVGLCVRADAAGFCACGSGRAAACAALSTAALHLRLAPFL